MRMKNTPYLATLCLCLSALTSTADTFTLKNGKVIVGKILKENPESYVLEIQVTKTIKDERAVAKKDVEKVDAEQKDLTAFDQIINIVPTPDFLSGSDYDAKIDSVTQFINHNPQSSKVSKAKAMLDTLQKEADVVRGGGIKFHGKLLSHEQYLANQYGLDARIESARIHSLMRAQQTVAALRAFNDFDRDYRTTLAYGDLAPYMIRVIGGHINEAKQLLSTFTARTKVRTDGLGQMSITDRGDTENAIKDEAAAIDAVYQKEKKDRVTWLTISPFHKASLEDTVRLGELEMTRLNKVQSQLGQDGGAIYRELFSAVKSGKKNSDLTEILAEARKAQIPTRYIDPLVSASK
jgi:hypothetical protein